MANVTGTVIRPAEEKDLRQLVSLCRRHADFERAAYSEEGKEELLARHLFESSDAIRCYVAEADDQLVGYATVLKQFSTWDAGFYLYLDCLFLAEEARGKGLGRLMMDQVKACAVELGCNVQWQTPEFNTDAIAFYEAIGARHLTKERFFWDVFGGTGLPRPPQYAQFR